MSAMRRILVTAVVLAVLAAGGIGWRQGWLRRGPSGPPSILLVSVDTLRADRVGSYGYAAAATPVMDGLAARGLRFTQASTVAPLTLPAHTSLLSGTFPTFHGVRDNGGFYAGEDLTTLGEVLKGRGYRTAGFVGAFVLDRRWGLAQGFDHYFDEFDLSKFEMSVGLDAAQRPGSEVVDHALTWLAQDRERPFLAWVHLYDPHTPYAPPEPYRSRFPATLQGAYDGEIASTDAQIGRLLDALRADGRLDSTIVVVVGDHGESLGEHGEQQHGFFIYDAAMHIPLIIAGPGITPRVVNDQVRIVDVMPTVLELSGTPPPPPVQGVSLLPFARGERRELLAFAETWYPRFHYGWSELTAVRDGRYKFIAAPRRELYDTQADPGETKDLSAENPRLADALEAALRDMAARTAANAAPQAPRTVEPEVEERLRALGYVGGSISRAAMEDRPRGDPKDKIGLYRLMKFAAEDSVRGRLEDGLKKMQEVLDADPDVIEAHTMVGNMQIKAGRVEQAIAAYQRALALDPEHEGAAWSLALAYKQAGRIDEAQAGFERVLALNPKGAKSLYQLADLAMRRRDFAAAAATLEKGLTLDGDKAAFLVKLGEARLELQQVDGALTALTEALKVKPEQPMAHFNLGLVHEAKQDWPAAIAAYESEITISPTLYQPHFNLGRLLSRTGRVSAAVDQFRAAVSKKPDFGTGYLYLAKALLDVGDLPGAERAATQGLASSPEPRMVPLGHYVLADVYSRQGRERDAARHVAAGKRAEREASVPGLP